MRITALLTAALILLAGAVKAAEETSADMPGLPAEAPATVAAPESEAPVAASPEGVASEAESEKERPPSMRQRNSQAAAAETTPRSSRPARGADTRRRQEAARTYISLDFTDVDLQVLIKFMSEQTGRNFVFDERVQGKATIISPNKMTEEDAYNVFLSVLQVKGFATVDVGNAIKIVPSREIRQESIPTEAKGRNSGEFITRLIPLRHTESTEVVQLLTPLLSKDGLITHFLSANTVMVIDTRQNIERLIGILRLIDVESPNETRIFTLTYAAAQDMAKTFELLFPSATPTPATTGAPAQAGRAAAAPRRGAATGGSTVRFIPDLRTNVLIVIAPPETMLEIADLIARLDITIPGGSGKIHVYYLENADAEETANVLSVLTGGYGGYGALSSGVAGGVAGAQRYGGATSTLPQGQQSMQGVVTTEFESIVKVTADKDTNSLVIVASPNDFETLSGVIKKLDIRRRQVFVEAMILEIDLDKGRDLGVEWRLAGEVGNKGAVISGTNFNFSGNVNSMLASLVSGNPMLFSGTGLLAGGLGGTVKLPDGTEVPAVAAILRAVQTRNDIKILSSPHLLTQNNKEAEIIVGENVPFISSQSRDTTNLANVINTVERKDVGVTLKITPHIHESEFVSMDIYQESSALKESAVIEESLVGPTTTKRSAKTTVLVKGGDTILIGGIVQETKTDIETKVPLLGSIPLLGWLFKSSSKSTSRTNLVILLTPHIIDEPGVFTEKLMERQRRLLKDFDNEQIRNMFTPRQETETP